MPSYKFFNENVHLLLLSTEELNFYHFTAFTAASKGAKRTGRNLGRENVLVTSRLPLKQRNFLQNNQLIWFQLSGAHNDIQQNKEKPLVSISDEPDTLYKIMAVLVKGHDKTVLDSYEYFMVLAAKELGLSVEKVEEPRKKIERFTLLKSVHIYKKHRVQYEMRTHYRYVELKHLTGSTANVYLEYIQRNLPEGVAMEVKKTRLEKLPEHIQKPIWDSLPQVEEKATKSRVPDL